jgi:hydrogenase nickel incorporation protein HypB
MKVQVLENILQFNDELADQNRRLFDAKQVFVINLMSSPGAGKTTLLEQTLKSGVLEQYRIGIIEGDIQTTLDGERLDALNVPVVQINTAVACHLDGQMIRNACAAMDLDNLDLLFIENVGNLVCPAEFRVGEHHKVALLSVPEGADKPLKYPLMFHESSLMLITKTDLLPYTDNSLEAIRKNARQVHDAIDIIEVSSRTGEGIAQWGEWIKAKRKAQFGI